MPIFIATGSGFYDTAAISGRHSCSFWNDKEAAERNRHLSRRALKATENVAFRGSAYVQLQTMRRAATYKLGLHVTRIKI
ncbi:hypothetical protein ACSS6W_010840 [Trichoderma asperelloides]